MKSPKYSTTSVRSTEILILGAGPTGLGAAYRLHELGVKDFLVLEGSDRVGGLATSYKDDNGFTWDIGGHIQFSHYDYFDRLMDRALGKEGWISHERESWVWMKNTFIPYPFQYNLRYLSKKDLLECVSDLVSIQGISKISPKNFGEWLDTNFGSALSRLFMRPYNYKVWAYPPEELSDCWVGERVAVTDLKKVIENILLERDELSWGPNNTFRFPKQGGTGAVWKGVADLIGPENFILNQPVFRIDPVNKIVEAEGQTYHYESLLSTIPLDSLIRLTDGISDQAVKLSSQLKYSSSNIFGIGLKGAPPEKLRSKCWMYFPESDCPFYRVTVFSNYSPNNVPDPTKHWSLMAEVSESVRKPVDQESLMEEVIQGMLNTGLIEDRAHIIDQWSFRADHGYPTPFIGRDEILKPIQSELESLNISSRGRFGAWKYEVSNQDHSLMQGVEWADQLVLGIPETTVRFPNVANANWGKIPVHKNSSSKKTPIFYRKGTSHEEKTLNS